MATNMQVTGTAKFGTVKTSTLEITGNGLTNNEVASSANIDAEKLEQQIIISKPQDGTVVDLDEIVHIARTNGELVEIAMRIGTAPVGAATITVDLQKVADGSAVGTGTSLLSSVYTFNSSSTANTKVTATLASTVTYAQDEALYLVVNETTGGGTQGIDLGLVITIREDGI